LADLVGVVMKLHDKHMELVDAVNNATDWRDKQLRTQFLNGWLEGLEDAGEHTGWLLTRADREQMKRGNVQAMCGGVFLDGKKIRYLVE
jgi:hypothetical protein